MKIADQIRTIGFTELEKRGWNIGDRIEGTGVGRYHHATTPDGDRVKIHVKISSSPQITIKNTNAALGDVDAAQFNGLRSTDGTDYLVAMTQNRKGGVEVFTMTRQRAHEMFKARWADHVAKHFEKNGTPPEQELITASLKTLREWSELTADAVTPSAEDEMISTLRDALHFYEVAIDSNDDVKAAKGGVHVPAIRAQIDAFWKDMTT